MAANRAQRRAKVKAEPEVDDLGLPDVVKLTGRDGVVQTVHLTIPTSLTTRYELLGAAEASAPRVAGAALGLCNTKVSKGIPYKYNLLEYGGQVFDRLVEMGVSPKEIIAAGTIAWTKCISGLPEVSVAAKEAEDFFEAPGDATSR